MRRRSGDARVGELTPVASSHNEHFSEVDNAQPLSEGEL
jgi:hypothetical protein